MRTCPKCKSDDIDLVERLGGSAMVLKCLDCGHQWQHGEPPQPVEPGMTQDQRLRARFPTVEDVPPLRFQTLRALVKEDRHKHWSEKDGEFRRRYASLLSREGFQQMTPQDFYEFYRSSALAGTGNAALVADGYVKQMGLEEYGRQALGAIEYLLFDERRTLEQKLTDLIDGRRRPATPGLKETILTKVLVAAMPDRMFPLLVYDSPGGSGKRQIAEAVFGLSLPERDRTAWTIGRLVIWSNDLFLDAGKQLGFADAPSAGDFVWWVWSEQRAGRNPLGPA